MANNHKAVYNLSVDNEFKVRLAAAMTAYVPVVLSEDPATPNHADRVLQAMKTLHAPMQWAEKFSLGAAAFFAGVSPTDQQLDDLVVQWWDTLALAPQI